MPLFDAGLCKAQLKGATSAYAQTKAVYRSAILRAIKEVEDNLSALRWLAAEARATGVEGEAAGKAAAMAIVALSGRRFVVS
ncbi:MAG: hypothetical protein KGI99_05145 [Bradyrhizobium sp.]|uniref:hypothetical protein n=1 Tax=Bradyrhizobium sp. TaxID=376 RepID=UPI001C289DA6|nr:hypothetical protein [Bradyrhizobium sp.]MBU6463262.1 hypothetical protein [Pseudomonadota bacterium]MDE2066621.1 hypothetical protein [Bradyrhizobium sp.]